MQKESLKEKPQEERKGLDLDTKKEIAKIGMTASMVTLVGTAFYLKGSKTMKVLHTASGASLVGFSLWHHYLYQPENKKKKEAKLKAKQELEKSK